MNVTKILIVGFGSIGKKHYNYLKKNFKKIEIGILLKDNKKKLNINNQFYSLKESLKFNPNAVIICSPSSLHYKHCLFFAKNKIHILVEKPLFNELKSVKILLKYINKYNLVFKIGYNLRYSYLLNRFRESLSLVKKIYFVNCEVGNNIKKWRNDHYTKTVSSSKKKGGGVILELSHEIDYLNWIFGNFKKIYSNYSKISNLKLDVEDNAFVIFDSLNNKFNKKTFKIVLSLDFLRHNNTRMISVFGEKGTLQLDFVKNILRFYSMKEEKWRLLNKNNDDISKTYLDQFIDFYNIIKNNKTQNVTTNDLLSVLQIIEFIKKSNKLDKVIKIKN